MPRLIQDLTKPVSLKPVEFNMHKFTKKDLKELAKIRQFINENRGPRGGLPKQLRKMEFDLVKLEGMR